MPLSVVLIPFGLLLAIFAVFSIVNLYHVLRFGSLTFFSFFVTFIYLGVTVLILFFTLSALADVNWNTPLLELAPSAPSLGI